MAAGGGTEPPVANREPESLASVTAREGIPMSSITNTTEEPKCLIASTNPSLFHRMRTSKAVPSANGPSLARSLPMPSPSRAAGHSQRNSINFSAVSIRPPLCSRLGLFSIAQTVPGLVNLANDDEIIQAVLLCRPLWTPAEKCEVGAIDIDFRPGPKLPLDTSRECGDCHACRGVRDKFKCAWRLGFDLVHPTELGAFVIVGPASNGRHQIGVYSLGGEQHTDGDLVQAVSGVVKQLGPAPCKVNIIRLEHHQG